MSDDLSGRATRFDTVRYRVRDLWADRAAGDTSRPLTGTLGAHDVLMLRLEPVLGVPGD